MSLLAAFIEELKGLNVQTDALPGGVKAPAFKTMRLEKNDCDCNCDCNCDCVCQCQENCNCDCDCQCKCDCDCNCRCGGEAPTGEAELQALTNLRAQKINDYAMSYERSKELRARFSAVMLVLRGEPRDRAAKAYGLDPNDLAYWSSGFKAHGPRILQVDKAPD